MKSIFKHSIWKYRIFFFSMSIGKIFEVFCSFLLEKHTERIWRESESNTELSARSKYAPIDIATNGTKYIFEFQLVCVGELGTNPF